MKYLRVAVLIGLVTVFFIAGMAFAQGGGQGKGGQGAPMTGCQQRFESMDANHDRKVTKEEFMAVPQGGGYPEEMFNAMDVNKQGFITKDQFCSGKGKGMGQGMRHRHGQSTRTPQ